MENIIQKARDEFEKMIDDFGSDPYHLTPHVPEVERWARHMLEKHPGADTEVVLLSAWLHDLGHYPIPTDVDHAIRGEQRARDFLEREKYPEDKLDKVLHCVRSHRCKDVMPESMEAKIIAFSDSASHMTDSIYFDMAKDDKEKGTKLRVYEKMERDLRDLSAFPEEKNKLIDLYEAWKTLLETYERLDLK
ncbi:MAG TPA: HD domain-containing protein [Candidatus Fimivivens sp.]|nr:HD domain-containing protein [Candidatus Fimivivens sp.]